MGVMADEVRGRLSVLIGLRLSIARRAADLRNFQFGRVRKVPGGSIGEYALHVQCPWRLEGSRGIVTGRADLWEPADAGQEIDWGSWDYENNKNLQDRRLSELLRGYDDATRSAVNETEEFVVEAVDADDCGGVVVTMSGGYRLLLFPAGTRGEDWRFFRPETEEDHFVITGGRIEATE